MSTANLPPAGTPADDEGFRRRAGALLRSAAGDLRRTSRSAAADLGLTHADYAAHLAPEQGFSWDLAQRAATVWPLNERDLVPVRNDCPRGVRVLRATESASSARVFQRGGIDYYEYRATAMSRLASFRPAWIRMLSVVTDDDPHNADVHWNNGHMLYQFTYCVGPVNYYCRWNGRDHVLRMNTGDSIWGLPFSPHTFTARNAEEPAYVLALTYGGELMGDAQHELAALGPDTARGFALDTDSAAAAQGRLLRSYLDASALPLEHAAELSGIPAGRLAGVADGGTTLTPDEVTALAAALRLSPRDLLPVVPDAVDGVSFCPAATSRSWYHPSAGHRDYRVRELAGDRLHPHTRALEIHPQRADSDSADQAVTPLRTHQHQYLHNVGGGPVRMAWQHGGERYETVLEPGASAYVTPFVRAEFTRSGRGDPTDPTRLLALRIGGRVTTEARSALGSMYPGSLERCLHEDRQWYEERGTGGRRT
ncbi:hypothetical protein SAZ_34550 [Streptomyces noursei ZPM]|uniref:(S)-2-hydroxypropylphosphonic acid epoxidase n=1 Tax=Streptomyces noursei TaxID=1971 RepID=A0A401RAY0_STRNR|nr:helix-turn-helix transcriptional regulator [Streptomyces noursei]AKA09049.1 hypothetical protein SAZ_34550 [Streptomyces noursei ZPM]EPY93082.1 hypothetical protein K530_49685 [Streptomyces noursei CCRC 11814]EXU91830.1 hypothetical protein P354_35420 [Streptomyces noursei PD-1]UWS75496.1 helix-turn-helix transcriptional regulator [Streptomyces noursei]GCB94811.1 (S)-2-hydroxypropylphosphonic acid epoxidase [Streptomyces noursei]